MEGGRSLEIMLMSARGLMNVERFSGMNVYAIVSLKKGTTKEKLQKVKTPVDREGGVNPNWNFPVELRLDGSFDQQNGLYVDFTLKRKSNLVDGVIGKVNVPVKGLLEHYDYYKIKAAAEHDEPRVLGYQVITPSGDVQGELFFSYRVTGDPAVTPLGPSSFASAPPYNDSNPPPYTGYPSYAPPPPNQLPPYAVRIAAAVLAAVIPACFDAADFGDL